MVRPPELAAVLPLLVVLGMLPWKMRLWYVEDRHEIVTKQKTNWNVVIFVT